MNFPGSGLTHRWAFLSEKPWLFGSWRKFTLVTVILLVVPALLLLISATYTMGPKLQRQTFTDLRVWCALFARQITEEFEGLSKYVESFASRRSTIQAALTGDLDQLEAQLEALALSNPKFSRAIFVSTNGTLLVAYPRDAAVPGADFSERDWVRGSLSAKGSYVSGVYRRTASSPEEVISIGCRVTDPHGRILGLISAQYRLNELNAWVDRTLDGTPIWLVLSDQRGKAIYDRSGSLGELRHRSSEIAKRFESGSAEFETTLENSRVLVCEDSIPFMGWSFYVLIARDFALQSLSEIHQLLLLYFGLFALLSSAISLVWIKTLFRYARSIEQGKQHLEYFCYTIAHNFRAPLRAISGFADVLLLDSGAKLDGEGKQHISRISHAGQTLDDLVQDLLAFGRVSNTDVQLRKIQPAPLIRQTIHELGILEGSSQVEFSEPLHPVFADPTLLHCVLKELLNNAVKFVPRDRQPKLRVFTEKRRARVILWIEDNGIGVEQKYQAQIFEIFTKLDLHSEGTGVGLALARNAAERMGGRITVQSEPGRGSAFGVVLAGA